MMNEMIQLLGIKKAYDIEKIREIYKDENNELVFDHYPGLEHKKYNFLSTIKLKIFKFLV